MLLVMVFGSFVIGDNYPTSFFHVSHPWIWTWKWFPFLMDGFLGWQSKGPTPNFHGSPQEIAGHIKGLVVNKLLIRPYFRKSGISGIAGVPLDSRHDFLWGKDGKIIGVGWLGWWTINDEWCMMKDWRWWWWRRRRRRWLSFRILTWMQMQTLHSTSQTSKKIQHYDTSHHFHSGISTVSPRVSHHWHPIPRALWTTPAEWGRS